MSSISKSMLNYFGLILAFLILLDIPWVLLNTSCGIYKGKVKGMVKNKAVIGLIWLFILALEALLVSAIVIHSSRKLTTSEVLLVSMFVGFVIYTVFNGTSLVMSKGWTLKVAFIDILWGTISIGVASTLAYYVAQKSNLMNY